MVAVPDISPDDVKAIFQTTLGDTALNAFIDAGVGLSNEVFGESDYSEDRLKQITLFVIAHLASTKSPRSLKEDFGDHAFTITGVYKEGWSSTSYGQTALLLDTKGILAGLGKKRVQISAFDMRPR